MPDEDKLRKYTSIEIESMQILLEAKAAKTALTLNEFINLSRLQGASIESIKAELIDDLENGGRIFGEFRNAVKATSNGVINRMADSGQFAEFVKEEKFRWVAVLVNTCPDCLDRHGEVKTMDDWELEGLPRTGYTVCKENCKCVLLPAPLTEMINPIMRNKK